MSFYCVILMKTAKSFIKHAKLFIKCPPTFFSEIFCKIKLPFIRGPLSLLW